MTYQLYQPRPFPPGNHQATLVAAAFRRKNSAYGSYSVLTATFADENGAEAKLWVPDYSKQIPNVFVALGESADNPAIEALLALRGEAASIEVTNTQRGENLYANVVAINGKRTSA